MKVFTLAVVLLCLTTSFSQAQPTNCATPEPTDAQRRNLYESVFRPAHSATAASRNDGTTCMPIRLYIFQEDDGSGGLSDQSMTLALAHINSVFLSMGIEFYYASRVYIANSDLYHYNQEAPDSDTEAQLVGAAGESTDAVNMYVVDEITTASGFQASGYAYLPYGNNNVYNRIVMDNSYMSASPDGTLSHEFGHYFGLLHTHQFTANGANDPDAEAVPRTGPQADCTVDGDMICDTEADPLGNSVNMTGCAYTGSNGNGGFEMDEYGNQYTPPTDNIMSYYSYFCQPLSFTPQQMLTMQQGLALRQTFTSNSLDAAPMAVAVPTNVQAGLNQDENAIVVTWSDIANNEFGYLIERSTTAPNSGFLPLVDGGVAADVTSFTDSDIAANTTYYYRIKPVNGDCNSYSAVATEEVGFIYCAASVSVCDEWITRVTVGSIDNDSSAEGCTAGDGFTRYDLSTDMQTDMSYAMQVSVNTVYNGDEVGVWIDWNQNGTLGDAGEYYNFPTHNNGFNGTITVPTTALPGTTRMRVRLSYVSTNALAPCGNQQYGEVEDYLVNVQSSALPVEWLYARAITETSGIQIEWATSVERDNDYFLIERLTSDATWQPIGQVAGNNGSGSTYRHLDAGPVPGINYYRLRQVDYDGTYSFSEVVTANWEASGHLTVFPNPANDALTLQFGAAEAHSYTLYDATGRKVLSGTSSTDMWSHTVDVRSLPEGWYQVQVFTQRGTWVGQKSVVVNR